MLSASTCISKINEYKSIQNKINGTIGAVDSVSDRLKRNISDLEKIIINGESFGNEELADCESKLNSIKELLQAVSNECSEKIRIWNAKLQMVLQRDESKVKKTTILNEKE